jgi:small-conductance mechanosensitive channel
LDLIYNALNNSTGCSDFYELIVKYFREAGIDASQPAVQVHYHSCLWKAQRSFIDQVITGA